MRVVTLASGSSGNCTLVSDGGAHLLIDAGISMRRIVKPLAELGVRPGDVSGILITHEHSDHIGGLAMMTKHHRIPVFTAPGTARRLACSVPGLDGVLNEITPGVPFDVGGFAVTAFETPHDAAQSVGYRIEGSAVFALATDMGCVTDDILAALRGADAVIIEANHDEDMLMQGPYPYPLKRRILSDRGHLSNGMCARLARELAQSGTRYITLGHLSRENNTPALAYRTVCAAVEGLDVTVCAAPQDGLLTMEFEGVAQCSASSSSASEK